MNAEQNKRIEQLYLELFDCMKAYARSSLQSESQAEEAVQETFRIACMKPDDLCASPNPQGWLLNALKFTIQNKKRCNDNTSRLLTDYIASQSREIAVSEDKVSLEILYGNIADLEEFKLLREMAVDGRSQLEMAQARGISLSACKKRVQRAKETLRKKIMI